MGTLFSHLPPALFHTTLLFFLRQFFHRIPPLSPALTYHLTSRTPIKKTILLTGFTSGLGYSTAILLLKLNVEHIILVGRNEKRCLMGLEKLRQEELAGLWEGMEERERLKVERMKGGTGWVGKRVSLLWCDQGVVGDVVGFAGRLREWAEVRRGKGIDAVILNAGVIPKTWCYSGDGWEESLQINFLTTALLAMILVPYLSTPFENEEPSRLVIINSDGCCFSTPPSLNSAPHGQLLQHANIPSNLDLSPAYFQRERYGATKALLLLFTISLSRKLESRQSQEGHRKVVVTSATPGLCKTGILGNMPKEHGAFAEMIAWPVEDGARAFLRCALEEKGREWNGKLVVSGLVVRPSKVLEDVENQERVFEEVVEELRGIAPEVMKGW